MKTAYAIGLAILSAATGAGLVQTLHAQSKPKAYAVAEIEVTDPSHPLFGRRFRVRHISRQPNRPGYVYVSYRSFMTLRIPVPATELAAPCPVMRPRASSRGWIELPRLRGRRPITALPFVVALDAASFGGPSCWNGCFRLRRRLAAAMLRHVRSRAKGLDVLAPDEHFGS